uniref:Uncharacterized protein n=1 Tax=Euplotes crassus TaxID=5936 RepID=A0A7S3KU27_EUPCR|mmetsp:Transcript_4558/g.4271  ORF Transcript_4558/g.4271 Transcript_4558/m.4271 type:complete len:178 (+) Transcript_4558:19-552(+)|eukprot:CAMPEP_0196998106 /NCGR_PEP_ID=MMETSP1380-20130617/3569_1 /TAXON_ID=5936 /ORGANISM="Euplotes crassus, Strain CT5" /LENGTH=177 /DNA_ID=CAMNT_0042414553 /DNA_START=19 /DNA_END=552 /DNA_ORIENTATION=-
MEADKTIKLTGLEKAIEESWGNGKVPFFYDTQGNASVFFSYKARLCELHKHQIGRITGAKTLEEIKEDVRLSFYYAMKNGENLVLFMEKLNFDFDEIFDEEYLPKEIFEPTEIVKEEVYKKAVREEEDVDSFGNKGLFEMRDTFKVVVLSTRNPEDEENAEIAEKFPSDKFDFIKIE